MRNNVVNNCANFRFLAIIKIPDVSLSKRCTVKGLFSLKNLLFEKISIRFFFDLVPPCTGIPDFLLTTIKSSLLSIIDDHY